MDQEAGGGGVGGDQVGQLLGVGLVGGSVVAFDAGLLDGDEVPGLGLEFLFQAPFGRFVEAFSVARILVVQKGFRGV